MKQRLLRFLSPVPSPVSFSERGYFTALPRLETRDLVLRPVEWKDARDIFAWSSDPEVARFVLWDAHKSVWETRDYIRSQRSRYRDGVPASWVMELKSTGQVVGTIGFVWYSRLNRSAELGYSLGRNWWNRGLTTQAVSAVCRSVFSSLSVNRLEAQHDVRNPASGRVLEKCGFQREGLLRSRVWNKGELADVILWSRLRSDP